MLPAINQNQTIEYLLDISENSSWITVTPSAAAKNTFLYLQEAGYFYCGPTYFTARRDLNSYLVKYVAEGRTHLEYRGRHYDLSKGDAFFIKCHEYQKYGALGGPCVLPWIHINGAMMESYFNAFYAAGDRCVVHLPPATDIPMKVMDLIHLYGLGGLYADITASNIITGILTELLIAANNLSDQMGHLPDPVRQTVDLIRRDYDKPLDLESMASMVSLNKQYFQKLFRKHTGYTPYNLLTATRINRAKELLRFSNSSVFEIAAAVGIENVSHFINVFKKHTDMTPNGYRKMWSSSNSGAFV